MKSYKLYHSSYVLVDVVSQSSGDMGVEFVIEEVRVWRFFPKAVIRFSMLSE